MKQALAFIVMLAILGMLVYFTGKITSHVQNSVEATDIFKKFFGGF